MPEEVLERYFTGAKLHVNMTKSEVILTQSSSEIFFSFSMLLIPRGIQLFIGTSPTLLKKLTQSYFSPSYHSQEGHQFLLYLVAQVWLGRIKTKSYVWPQTISNMQKRPRITFTGLRKTKSKMRPYAPEGNFISEQF